MKNRLSDLLSGLSLFFLGFTLRTGSSVSFSSSMIFSVVFFVKYLTYFSCFTGDSDLFLSLFFLYSLYIRQYLNWTVFISSAGNPKTIWSRG